jgi:CarD family transcriptional regulator
MAQTKTTTKKGSQSRSNGSRSGSGGSSTRKRTNARSSSAKRTSARGSASKRSTSRSTASRNGRSTATAVKDTVASGAGSVKDTVTSGAESVKDVAGKAKTAALAGGAAAAGLTATVLITRRANKQRKVLGVSIPKRNGFKPLQAVSNRRGDIRRDTRKVAGKVTSAADRADRLGRRVSSVASGVREVSKTADEAAKKA